MARTAVSRLADPAAVLVVGAGINGLMTADALRRAGARVTLCDRGAIPEPSAASHGMHRLIHPFGADEDKAFDALQLWRQALAALGCDGFVASGVLTTRQHTEATGAISPEAAETYFPGASRAGPSVFAPEYGILLAEEILYALVGALHRAGVAMRPKCPVVSVDPEVGKAVFTAKHYEHYDHIVIAAGHATSAIEGTQGIAGPFRPCRSYVLYLAPNDLPDGFVPTTAWADLLGADLWGMPPVGGRPAKFGFGGASHPDTGKPEKGDLVHERFVQAYTQIDPRYDCLRTGRVASNVFAKISGTSRATTLGRCTVVTSCNGAGFKFAPLAAQEAAGQVLFEVRKNSRQIGHRRTGHGVSTLT